ncbi:TPA: hypothetical protein ACUJC3_004610, partial [Salmonella enterica]
LNKTTSWLLAGYGLAGRRDGLVEPINTVTGYAGLRRHLTIVPYLVPAGASMSLRDIQKTDCTLPVSLSHCYS